MVRLRDQLILQSELLLGKIASVLRGTAHEILLCDGRGACYVRDLIEMIDECEK